MAEFAIDQKTIEQLVLNAVQDNILTAVENMSQDPAWLARVEKMINETVTYQTIARIGSIDINSIINERVDANVDRFIEKLREKFVSTGITDQATQKQMIIMDEATVFENNLVAKDLEIADTAVINQLIVKGSINTDNFAWDSLSNSIREKTLNQFNEQLRDQMIQDIATIIKTQGIDSDQIRFGGQVLVEGNQLSGSITETNIKKLGLLESLTVVGPANINETVMINRKRVGINTEEPEMALSVWDEEVAINVGKYREKTGYIGTSRPQALAFGTNRNAYIEITADGLTQIKKLQVGVHRISHETQVPGYSGTKGDIVFNSNPNDDHVFAWVCLGAYKWKPLRAAE
jgi:hypothetical protein